MKEDIRRRARELGFDDCRFTTADPPASAMHFQQWLAEGHHGEMAYLTRTAPKRVSPREVLAGVKSIITLAVSYGESSKFQVSSSKFQVQSAEEGSSIKNPMVPAAEHAPRSTLHGLVARYARYQDYHKVLTGRLRELSEFVEQLGGQGTRALWYVDTGPVLERDLAQRAGLGFIGKHTNLISRRLGNWIFLAEILITIELEPDQAERNHCGSCARCLAACPTGAITAPFQLDARRCISYLTIELTGPIPLELRTAIGNRIYGCDDCLAVCPWNRFAREGAIMRESTRPELGAPDLLDLLALDEAGFKRRFAGTPMLRAKRRGLLRNVCVALGNTADRTALPALERATRDPEPLIAEHAQWAIEEIEKRGHAGG
jgi:epoxyqueuosine reductase